MGIRTGGLVLKCSVILAAIVAVVAVAVAKEREWTDKTGKYKLTAELIEVKGDKAVLRRENGTTTEVPIEKLTDADQALVREFEKGAAAKSDTATAKDSTVATLTDIASRFYADLRNQERTVAKEALSKKAEELFTGGKSPLAGLPQPEVGKKAITPGDAKIDGEVAEVPVLVRAGGRVHKTKLHLRKEGDEWRVFALSAVYPDGEKSINFEIAAGTHADPLADFVGKEFPLAGITIEGKPLDMTQFDGKVVLVDFWATWCGPCRAEIPNIKENWDKYHSAGFDVVAVSVDRDLKALGGFVAEEKPPWTVVADNHPRNKAPLGEKYGIRSIPAFVLIGQDGKVATVNCRGAVLGQQLAKLLGKAAAK